ncbi:MAG TPA: CHASE sensor domain-containing protein [Verrucomicrobiae bacterium]|jgi:hypothetical protein|nr:CHASE sensor domain-containing protein [Verrucomicrobiae bacterium]
MKTCLSLSLIGLSLLFASVCPASENYNADEAKIVSHVIAAVSASPLAFQDKASAEDILSSLKQSGYLNFGMVLDGQKHVFASYFKPNTALQKKDVMASILKSLPAHVADGLFQMDHVAFAITPMRSGSEVIGYVIVGKISP